MSDPQISADVFAKALEAYPPHAGISDIKHLAQLRAAILKAIADERERCAKLVCGYCCDGNEPFDLEGVFFHAYDDTLFGVTTTKTTACLADPIRRLAPGESGEGEVSPHK